LDETLGALDQAVKSGKALYAGISNYNGAGTADVVRTCEGKGFAKPVIHQPRYNMLDRWIEPDLLPVTERFGIGIIVFCPLAQGLLTNKYLAGIPSESRASSTSVFLNADQITEDKLGKIRKLNELAKERGQSLAQMALAWVLRLPAVTTALIGASRSEQIKENVAALEKATFSEDELKRIDAILAGK
jgi:L-glyceraldehyde 3-phosphate reductase